MDMRSRLTNFSAAISSLSSSRGTFRVVTRISQNASPPTPSTLYVLDSSFNPPTRAHLHIAISALREDHGPPPKRLLLLLAMQNADKAPVPASFEHRIAMMTLLAHEVQRVAHRPSTPSSATDGDNESGRPAGDDLLVIDIGLTKHPYFLDKASAISSSGLYPSSLTQVHLVGYDTLTRILDPKYYPQAPKPLAVLEPFLSVHRLRVTYRIDVANGANSISKWRGLEDQYAYLEALRQGKLEAEGLEREWASRIELVRGFKPGEEAVSSTRVREAARRGDVEHLRRMITDGIREWVLQENLYLDG